MSGPQYSFGSGVVFGKKSGTTPTPVRLGALQDVSVDISFTTKELYGQYQFPLAIGRGTAKITGKAKFGQFDALAFNDLFFGNSSAPAAGETIAAVAEAATITANIVTASHNATFGEDLGVTLASDGTILQRVSGAPSGSGNYACNETTGVYTFNNAINNTAVLVSYSYTDSSNGRTISIANQLLGNAPQFSMILTQTFNSNKMFLKLNACMSGKLTLATKLEDFTIPELDFSAFADSSNNIGGWYMENL